MFNLTRNTKILLIYSNVIKKSQRWKSDVHSTSRYCLDLVRQHDYENFICTLLLKNRARATAFAVRSFNVEVSRVADHTSQSTIALMRMKFWEETIDKCFSKDFNNVPQHPVAIELYKAITNCNLTKRYFKNLIKSRTDRFMDNSFLDIHAIEKYSEQSISNVYYLILEGCGVKNVNADHAASHLGKAQGLVQQLRITHLTKNLNFIPLPQNLLVKYQISHEQLIRGKPSEQLSDCCFEIASQAHQHLQKARSLLTTVPSNGRAALLPAVAVQNYLTKLQTVHHDVLHPNLHKRTWEWIPRLWYTNFVNKF